ncbi:hypothetical protein H257_01343 [Aphanomyces astaci]|uniref:Asl1-like glycosyl hydrolase catalytic domain-containing protein n=2 Tax=Aphanomyces astaci TaxID=112090 RepID=W4H9I4_APHAT|nr:hypothetical protein H257_01343 [Aphanomyces astaci]ETV87939.1 hypothetical protein H257_01343 [Aphanomyces astaci]|eukprot:XP_009822802.1 hypothetical protein H257_01343 [Aphanomyces astaci]
MWRSLRLCTAVVGVVSANTAWTVCNRKLLKDGALFFIRGVNYQPAPIDTWSGVDLLLRPELWQRDLPLLRNMNANAAKVYAFTSGNPDGHNAYLDAAFNNGYLPIYTMFSIWVSPYPMSAAVAIDSPDFAQFVPKYEAMAKEVACHPGTMGFVIGGEMNGIWEVKTQLFWSKFNALSQAVRRGIASANCASPAPKILTTNFIDDYAASVTYGEQFRADVDVWGINIYDKRFGSDKMLVHSRATSRPFLFGEYGVPFASNWNEAIGAASWDVGMYLMSMANLLRDSFLGKDPSGTAVLVGGFIFEFTDEWWKQGFPSSQEFGWDPAPIFPMGYGSEEFFGLFSVARGPGLNKISPRQVVSQLATLWAISVDGQSYNCANPTPPATPRGPTTVVQSCGKDPSNGVASFSDSICSTPNGALGCQGTGGHCRYCQLYPTPQSSPYVGCPATSRPPTTTTSSMTCANPSQLCLNGVALLSNPQSCEFGTCPTTTCDADPVMLVRGVGMVYDATCVTNSAQVGCDLLRPGCRYCSPPNSRTAFAPCPTIPSKSTCVATLSDLNMGLGVVEDGGCAGGGIGCDATRPTCRYCKMKETAQSKLLNACPGVTSTSTSGFAAADDSESAVEGTSTTNNASTILLLVATVVGVVVAGVLVAKVVFRKPKKSEKQGEVAMHTPSGAGIL